MVQKEYSASQYAERSYGVFVPDSIRLILRGIFGRFLATKGRLARVELLVVSPGGVGTTFLMKHLARFKKTNSDADVDYLKHLPSPPRFAPKTIFIRGPGESVYASIKRRGWVARQGAKLGSVRCIFSRGEAQKAFFLAAVRAQEERWRAAPGAVLFVDYDDIWRRADEIMTFAGIDDRRFIDEFPERKSRSSS